MTETLISIRDVSQRYANGVQALKNVSLEIHRGEVVCVVGPSGSGKTTLLRVINGLEPVSAGAIAVDGIELSAAAVSLQKLRTRVGMVFQQFNLFPHMTVLENLMLAPRQVLGEPVEGVRSRALGLLEKVGLSDKSFARPSQLSGGQQQRVAIARALAMQPEVMLFDEPTSALDPEKTGEVLDVMKQLASEGMTMLVATHEMGFARAVAHRVLFMEHGEIAHQDAPAAFFNVPANERLREFLGQVLKA